MKSHLTHYALALAAALTIAGCGSDGKGAGKSLFDQSFQTTGKAVISITPNSDLGYWEGSEETEIGYGISAKTRFKIEKNKVTIAMRCSGIENSVSYAQKSAPIRREELSSHVYINEQVNLTAKVKGNTAQIAGCVVQIPKDAPLILSISDKTMETSLGTHLKLADLEESK